MWCYHFGCVQKVLAKSAQNKWLAYLCNISRKAWGGGGAEVEFLPANKHESFLQVDSIILGLLSQACPKCPKQVYNIFVISHNISRKTLRMNLIFCLQTNVKGFFKLLLSF